MGDVLRRESGAEAHHTDRGVGSKASLLAVAAHDAESGEQRQSPPRGRHRLPTEAAAEAVENVDSQRPRGHGNAHKVVVTADR